MDQHKRFDIHALSEPEKLKLKNSKPTPTPDIAKTKECTSRGLKVLI